VTLIPEAERPLRADAARNRELILATARRVFAERGIGVTLNDIAHEAGVGVGTVYRRFADKDSLIEALLAAKFASLTELADRATAEPDPRTALRAYLWGAFELRASDRALSEVIVRAAKSRPSVDRERRRLDDSITAVVDRAVAAGVVRDGFLPRDVPILSMMIGTVADRTRECGPDVWRRYAQVIVDGVCPPLHTERLCGKPLDAAGLAHAMHPDA
jgi:AcrR family transcriptional regulator